MKKRVFMALILAAAALLALAGFARAEDAPAELTLMIYMCGSNLESEYGSACADIEEIRNSGVNPEAVNVLLLTGGSACWHMAHSADNVEIRALKYFDRSGDNQWKIGKTLPPCSMGDKNTLIDFIDWGVENYPAGKYALILWDHGAGPLEGLCMDELNAPDRLSIGELAEALAESSLPGKLSWIGMDACLMATAEVARAVSPYAEYMIASQETEPASGWDYGFLSGVESDGDGAATGRRVIDAYMECPRSTPSNLTLACVDLSALDPLEACLNDLYGKLAAGLTAEEFSKLSRLRVSATGFGRAVESDALSQGYDLVDVVSLSDCLARTDDEADGVRRAVENAVVYHRENLDDCCGLSLYHPYRNRYQYRSGWGRAYDELDFCDGYSAYVNSYGRIMTGEQLVLWNDLKNVEVSGDERSQSDLSVTLKLSQAQIENLASARLVVLARNLFDDADDAYFRVYSSAEVDVNGTVLSSVYDGSAMKIVNESGTDTLTGAISYRVSEDGLYLISMYPVEADGTRWKTPIVAEYEKEGGGWLRLRGYQVYDGLTGAYSSRADVDLSRFSGVTFINDYRLPARDDTGEMLAFDRWEEDAHRNLQMKSRYTVWRTAFAPSFALKPLMTEDLYAGYEITDTQGNTYMSELTRMSRESSAQYYAPESSLGGDVPDMWAMLYPEWEDRSIMLFMLLGNASDRPQGYNILNLKVNGMPIENPPQALFDMDFNCISTVQPGEEGLILLTLDAGTLSGLPPQAAFDRLEGTLAAYVTDRSRKSTFVQFSAEPGISFDSIFHEDGAAMTADESIDDLPLSILVKDEETFLTTRVILQPSLYASASRVLVNLSLYNGGDTDKYFEIRDIRLNGASMDEGVVLDQDTGERVKKRVSIPPNQIKTVNILLDAKAVSSILPDVVLNRVSYRMVLSDMRDGHSEGLNSVPFDIDLSVPLNCFCQDAVELPPQELVDLARQADGTDETAGVRLFGDAPCDVRLQALYAVNRSVVMLLKVGNSTDRAQCLDLGHAELDGKPAEIGTTVSAYVQARNNRNRTYYLNKPQWMPGSGVSLTLQPGQEKTLYVTVTPEDDAQDRVRRIGFRSFAHEKGRPDEYEYRDSCTIDAGDEVWLGAGALAAAPLSEITVTPGLPMARPEVSPLFRDEIQMPEGDLTRWRVPLTFSAEADERLETAYYILLRRVESDAQLAALNIDNDIDPENHASRISFADGRQWLIYEACGLMDVAEDGRSCAGTYPGLRPVIRAHGESLPLTVTLCGTDENGALVLEQILQEVYFMSTEYPDTSSLFSFGNLAMTCDTASGTARLKAFDKGGGEMIDALRGIVCQDVFMAPLDADSDGLKALIEDGGEVKQTRVQLLDDPCMQLAVEPVTDVENYMVAFYYKNAAGELRCARPVPLSDFLR